jgi:hypothetical protein
MTSSACDASLTVNAQFYLAPVLVALSLCTAFGLRLRLDAKRDQDPLKAKRGLKWLLASWLLCILVIALDNSSNSAPGAQYSTKALAGVWMLYLPAFVLARDRGFLCPPTGRCRCCRTSEEFCKAAGNFGEFATLLLGSVGVPVAGLFSCIGCHGFENEMAHWIVMMGFLLEGGLLLLWSGPTRAREQAEVLQLIEGWMWFAFGALFLAFFPASSGGGLLYPAFHGGAASPDWRQDQRHVFISLLFLASGGLAVMLNALGIKSGLPMSLLFGTLFAAFQVQSAECDLQKYAQMAAGLLCLMTAVMRYMHKFLECSLIIALTSGVYVASSRCALSYFDSHFDAVAFSILLIVSWGAWWAYFAWLFRGYWFEIIPETLLDPVLPRSRFAAAQAGAGGRYAVVSDDDEDDDAGHGAPRQGQHDPFVGGGGGEEAQGRAGAVEMGRV